MQLLTMDLSPKPCGVQVHGMAGQNVAVQAAGPTTVSFQQTHADPAKLGGVLTTAGSYLLHVRLTGVPVTGWPRVLHVLAAASDPPRCGQEGSSPVYTDILVHVCLWIHSCRE